MMREDDPYARARELADALSPMIEAHLASARQRLTPVKVPVRDSELVRAAAKVAEAIDRLDAEKFSRGEIAARMTLERQARALHRVLGRVAK